ncbi:MAG: carbon storage regulator [Clostridium sp.]
MFKEELIHGKSNFRFIVLALFYFLKNRMSKKGGRRMLALGIRTGETINIGDNIKITFIKVKDNTVRVSIDAPKDVIILRDGVQDKNKEAILQVV